MTDYFPRAVKLVIEEIEHAVMSNDPRDSGGATNFGIAQSSHPGVDVSRLTRQQAESIYRTEYWRINRCDEMPWWAALPVFDCDVNQGVRIGARLLQRTLRVTVDGVIGAETLSALQKAPDPLEVMAEFMSRRLDRYANSDGYATFGSGWQRRVIKVSVWAFCPSS